MARILCGRADMPRHYHESVDAVRVCQASSSKPTERMLAYVSSLNGDRELAALMSFEECKTYIDNIKAGAAGRGGMTVVTPRRGGNISEHLKMPFALIKDIPQGYYALAREHGESYAFWRVGVQKDTAGKILSWRLQSVPKRTRRHEVIKLRDVLVITTTGDRDDSYLTLNMKDRVNDALKRILIGGDSMKKEYGKREGFCGQCGRELTDEQSLAIGIGPDCLRQNPHLREDEDEDEDE